MRMKKRRHIFCSTFFLYFTPHINILQKLKGFCLTDSAIHIRNGKENCYIILDSKCDYQSTFKKNFKYLVIMRRGFPFCFPIFIFENGTFPPLSIIWHLLGLQGEYETVSTGIFLRLHSKVATPQGLGRMDFHEQFSQFLAHRIKEAEPSQSLVLQYIESPSDANRRRDHFCRCVLSTC